MAAPVGSVTTPEMSPEMFVWAIATGWSDGVKATTPDSARRVAA
jgi:hypothetical protein